MFDKLLLTPAIAICFLALLFAACDNDDDAGGGPSELTFPHTIDFANFSDQEFRMWTNGMEVSTAGLNYENFIADSEDLALLEQAYYEALLPITFTADSVFSEGPNGEMDNGGYFLSNDSLYVTRTIIFGEDSTLFTQFLGLGSPAELRMVQGFSQFCQMESNTTQCRSSLRQYFETFETAAAEHDIESLDGIGSSDTLIVVNRYVILN